MQIGRQRSTIAVALLAALCIAVSIFRMSQETLGLVVDHFNAGPIPISVLHKQNQKIGPMVIVAHGFAGSRPMMKQLAETLARNDYLAVTFDFSGHGRNRVPLTGDLTSTDGATAVLVRDIASVASAVRSRYEELPESMAVVGHSMASDLVVRYAQSDETVIATVGLAMFSPAVTATSPRNLLIINGQWEPRLNDAALEVLAQVAGDQPLEASRTYGSFTQGDARRLEVASHVEHVGVLFSVESAAATVRWLNSAFGWPEASFDPPLPRGRWILLLIAGIVATWWSLVARLPRVAGQSHGPRLDAASTAWLLLLPMIVTPLLLSLFTIGFLPVLVGDYLAVHLGVYGLLTVLLAVFLRGRTRRREPRETIIEELFIIEAPAIFSWRRFLFCEFTVLILCVPLGIALHWQVASFIPTVERLPLLAAITVGTLCWFSADEWATRSLSAWRFAYPASKLAFLISLGIAVALDFDGLFFLLLIVPLMVPVLIVFGLLSRWTWRATGSPFIAAISNSLALSWAISVTFPWVGVTPA